MNRFTSFIKQLKRFAQSDARVESTVIVGSYARNTYTDESDLDVVIVSPFKQEFLESTVFAERFGTALRAEIEYYGACTSVRVWYLNGLEVEFGFVEPSWIQTPLDAGTRQVLGGGYLVLCDKKKYFQNL